MALREGLLKGKAEAKDGPFGGKSNTEIARLLSERFNRPFTPSEIRHTITRLRKKDDQGRLCATLGKGRPKLSQNKKPREFNLWAAACNELLKLTGISASELFKWANELGYNTNPAIKKGVFHARLKQLDLSPPLAAVSIKPRDLKRRGLLGRYRLRVHALTFEGRNRDNYWIVIGGYEQTTGFLHFQLLNVIVEQRLESNGKIDEAYQTTRKRGRPRKMENATPCLTIAADDQAPIARLTPDLLKTFIDEMADILRLPLLDVTISDQIGRTHDELESIAAVLDQAGVLRDDPQTTHRYLPARLPPALTLAKLAEKLSDMANRYNKNESHAKVKQERKKLQDALKKARKPATQPRVLGTRDPAIIEESSLEAFYRGHTLVFPKEIKATSCKPITINGVIVSLSSCTPSASGESAAVGVN